MPPGLQPVLAFVQTALSVSQVGTWEYDMVRDRVVTDTITASIFGIDPEKAAAGVSITPFSKNIHPDDLRSFEDKLDNMRERGGLFVIEYRTHPTPADVRWVLARGRYERDPHTGNMIGRGIVIDITDSKSDGHVEDRAVFLKPEGSEPSLENLAALAIQARDEIKQLGEQKGSALWRAVDALLWAVGRALAIQEKQRRRVN